MENTQHTEHTKYTRVMLLILALVLLLASIGGYIVSRNLPANKQGQSTKAELPTPTIAPTLIPYPVKGSFVLTTQGGLTGQVGAPLLINLSATGTDSVAGYDVIFSYDTTAFSRQSIQNKADAFRIFTYDRGSHISISATKNLSVTAPVTFAATPILSFTLLPQKKGSFVFSLKSVGNESSKLVNEAAEVTYPETADLRLEIN